MNENIDLIEILKNCPVGTKLYTPLAGEVTFVGIFVGIKERNEYQIDVENKDFNGLSFNKEGRYFTEFEDGECLLFPGKEIRDWSKFKAPWHKKEKFDPKKLQPFDSVLVRDQKYHSWGCCLFSHRDHELNNRFICINGISWRYCIPYNDDTKHLVETKDDSPVYYIYWED